MNEHTISTTDNAIREQVRERYASAALTLTDVSADGAAAGSCCAPTSGDSCCSPQALENSDVFGAALYGADEAAEIPELALLASLGCGNPTAVAHLREGEVVLDLGSGGGIDVLLSAHRVGPNGFAYGIDMTDEMLDLARANATKAGATNVEFIKGTIEQVPLADASVDVVISNCVINLSADKPAVIREMFRVLRRGGRIGVSDVVAENQLSPTERAERGTYVGCIAGALSIAEYESELTAAGFTQISVELTHQVAPQMHGAIVKGVKP